MKTPEIVLILIFLFYGFLLVHSRLKIKSKRINCSHCGSEKTEVGAETCSGETWFWCWSCKSYFREK